MNVSDFQNKRGLEESTLTMGKYTIFNGGTGNIKFGKCFAESQDLIGTVIMPINDKICTL